VRPSEQTHNSQIIVLCMPWPMDQQPYTYGYKWKGLQVIAHGQHFMGQNSWVPTVRESGTRAGNRRLPAATSTETLDAECEMWHNISYDTMSGASSSQSICSNAADEAAASKCFYSGVTMHQGKTADLPWLPADASSASSMYTEFAIGEQEAGVGVGPHFGFMAMKQGLSEHGINPTFEYSPLKQQASGSARHIWSSLGGRHVWKPSTARSSPWCPLYEQGENRKSMPWYEGKDCQTICWPGMPMHPLSPSIVRLSDAQKPAPI
jgi:hypothetical protein